MIFIYSVVLGPVFKNIWISIHHCFYFLYSFSAGCNEYGNTYLQYQGYDQYCFTSAYLEEVEFCQNLCNSNSSCLAVGYHEQGETIACALYNCTPITEPTMLNTSETITLYIRNCASGGVPATAVEYGSSCNTHTDCSNPNTECWNNTCTCTLGYSLEPDTQTCVAGKCLLILLLPCLYNIV